MVDEILKPVKQSAQKPLSEVSVMSTGCRVQWQEAWRLELFYKSLEDLKGRVVPFLKEHHIRRVNLTNKKKDDHLLQSVQILQAEIPQADICVHVSLKYQYRKSLEDSQQQCRQLLQDLHNASPACSILLVTGSGKRPKLCTVKCLSLAKQWPEKAVEKLFVAYNPYLPDAPALEEERQRLSQKLASGMVAGIYLQMGTDLERLQAGLQYLHGLTGAEGLQLYGSVFLPTKKLLAQMRFRPWNGVFLSRDYLSDVSKAESITRELLDVYHQHGVAPLIETSIAKTEELRRVHQLLGI